MLIWLLSLLIVQASPDDVPAQFVNMPGATPAALAQERARCLLITTGPNASTELGRPLAPPIGRSTTLAGPTRDTVDHCMIVRGWRLYALRPHERRKLTHMGAAIRQRTLDELLGAPRPKWGQLVREDRRGRLRAR